MQLITFATYLEAKNFLDRIEAFPLKEKHLYKIDKGLVMITGIGSLAAASQITPYLPGCEGVWNFGLAGALKPNQPIGTIQAIKEVSKWLSFPEDIDAHSHQFGSQAHPPLTLSDKGASLLSSDYPIHSPRLRDELSSQFDLIDMEGYGIAYAAKLFDKPCTLHKVVSDFVSLDGPDLIRKHCEELSLVLADYILAVSR